MSYTDPQIGTLTISGDPARFVATERVPVSGLSMDFEPVQDLHGYEYPWPAGGGKNLLNPNAFVQRSGYSNLTCTSNENVITVTGYNSGGRFACWNVPLTVGEQYTIKLTALTGSPNVISYKESDTEPTVWLGGSGSIAIPINSAKTFTATMEWLQIFVELNADPATVTNLQVEKGSTATAWSPYENICPITGRDSVTVYVSPEPVITDGTEVHEIEFPIQGYNQWDEEWELGQFNNQTGLPISANDCIRSKNFIPVVPNTSYYTTYGNGNMQVFFYGADESFISQTWVGVTNLITTPNGCYKMKFRNASSYGTTYNHDISINYPATETGYYPYKGRTVYAGTLTINEDGSGTIVSTMASVDLGSLEWAYVSSYSTPIFTTPLRNISGKPHAENGWCSQYKWEHAFWESVNKYFCIGSGTSYLNISDSRYTDAAAFKAAMNGVQLVYELGEPVTTNLDPIEITTLIGLNYVWTSDNNLITISFPYNKEVQPMALTYEHCWTYPKAYIDKLTARIAALEDAVDDLEAAADAKTAAAPAETRETVAEEITVTEEPETEPVTKKGGK